MASEKSACSDIRKRPPHHRLGTVETNARRAEASVEHDMERPGAPRKKVSLLAICIVALLILVIMWVVLLNVLPTSTIGRATASWFTRQEPKNDRLLGGLLVPGFDERSCLSRYKSMYYRKNMTRSPSAHLTKRLREQEALQRRCGPGTEAYRRATLRLDSGQNGTYTIDGTCKYLVLAPHRGIGNKMISMASAFLYALLTDRVLLVHRGIDVYLPELFCEPFMGTSWLLPPDFPLKNIKNLTGEVPESYRKLAESNRVALVSELPYVFLDLDQPGTFYDNLFYCEAERQLLHRAPWLVMRTDAYFVPALFLNPAYQEELDRLFPQKDSVFYLLSNYLFTPTNEVWGLITRFYNSYLRNSDELLGIQVRVFDGDNPLKHVLDQILACTSQEHLLPEVRKPNESVLPVSAASERSKVVLMTGLSSWYYENVREKYWQSATATGEVVSVHQPSHEEHQIFGKTTHTMKALAEMYLLSMTDAIVTSARSTFGYVGQGLGGLTPWIMFEPNNNTAPNPPCRRAVSMEPCFHLPPAYDCRAKREADTGKLVPHVRHCEDVSRGLQLVEPSEQVM